MANLNVNGSIKSLCLRGGGNTLVDIGIEEIGDDFIKWKNGLQLVFFIWNNTGSNWQTITIPKPFKDTSYKVFTGFSGDTTSQSVSTRALTAQNKTTTSFESWSILSSDKQIFCIGYA